MNPKRRLIIVLVSVLLAAILAAAAVVIIRSSNKAPQKLSAFFHLHNPPVSRQLESMLDEFQNLYPEIDLEYELGPYQEIRAALIETLNEQDNLGKKEERQGVISVLAGGDLDLQPPDVPEPSPWISSAWGLYYNSSRLEDLGYSSQALQELQQQGFTVFTDTFVSQITPEESVYSAGTAFFWPWLAWIQHLELLNSNGVSPEAYDPLSWSTGISEYDRLVEEGLVNSDHRSINFAGSQLAVSGGSSLFVLSDSSIYSTFPPDDRTGLEFIPFPGTFGQGWRIGSGFHLGAFTSEKTDRRASAAEEQLLNYLHSESVADRFLRQTGTRLLPRASASSIREIPSLTQRAREAEVQDLLKYLN